MGHVTQDQRKDAYRFSFQFSELTRNAFYKDRWPDYDAYWTNVHSVEYLNSANMACSMYLHFSYQNSHTMKRAKTLHFRGTFAVRRDTFRLLIQLLKTQFFQRVTNLFVTSFVQPNDTAVTTLQLCPQINRTEQKNRRKNLIHKVAGVLEPLTRQAYRMSRL